MILNFADWWRLYYPKEIYSDKLVSDYDEYVETKTNDGE